MWPRNPKDVHGNVFKDSTFIGTRDPTTFARSPKNGDATYPFAEVVLLNTQLTKHRPRGGVWSDARIREAMSISGNLAAAIPMVHQLM